MDFLVLNLLFSRCSTKSTRISPPRNLMGISLKFMAPGFSNPRFERNFAAQLSQELPLVTFQRCVFSTTFKFWRILSSMNKPPFWIERKTHHFKSTSPNAGVLCFSWDMASYFPLNGRAKFRMQFRLQKSSGSTRHKHHSYIFFQLFNPFQHVLILCIQPFVFQKKGNKIKPKWCFQFLSKTHLSMDFPCRWSPVRSGSQTAIWCFFSQICCVILRTLGNQQRWNLKSKRISKSCC